MKKACFFLVLSIVFFTLNAQTDKRLKGVEKDLDEILELTKAPGFAVAVVEKNKVVYAKGFGFKDVEGQAEVDPNTLFAIGSSTKAFTSALLGQLRDEDKLSFEDSPRQYLPRLEFYNDEMNNSIIIEDLMSHRTGLPRHDLSWYLFPSNSRDSLISRIQYMEPFTGVRQQWFYNNFMFMLQGAIAEQITGKTWEENISERIFKPLGMDRSITLVQDLEGTDNVAFGYALKKDSINEKQDYYKIAGMSPAGSIYSSVNDLSKWMITWVNNGKYKGEQIIPEAYVNEAISSQMVINGALPSKEFPDIHFANYGYGWILSSNSGHYQVSHGGNIDGFSALVGFFPSDSLGITVLTNQNGSALPSLVFNVISDKMLDLKGRDWVENFKKNQKEAKEARETAANEQKAGVIDNTNPSHILHDYTGTYHHPGYGTFKINLQNDSLFAQLKLMKLWLKHVHYDVFEPYKVEKNGSVDTSEPSLLKFNFIAGTSGDISFLSTKIEPTIDPVRFKRTPNILKISAEDLEKYVGKYKLMGTNINIYIKDDKLFLFVTGQPEYELIATDMNKFSFKAIEGFKVEFKEEEDGSVKEALLIQPHGNYIIVKGEE
jgi:CubicO group peptidase (beta-lactamase class C family)